MRKNRQAGGVLVLVALLLPLLVAATGMVMDFGMAYWEKSRLQNAAPLAGSRAVLVTETEVRKHTPTTADTAKTQLARQAADRITAVNLPPAEGGSLTAAELWVKPAPSPAPEEKSTYFCKVEMEEPVAFRFMKLILPQALLPSTWKVKAYAWAKANLLVTGDAPSLYDQLLAAGYRETDWTFYGIKDKFVEQGYSEAVARKMADDVTLRTGAIIFGTDGVRRQTIEMKGDNSQFHDFRSLFIDFHPDIHTSAALRENWNLTDIAGMTIEEAGEYFERLKISFIDGKLPDGTSLSRTKWEDLIAMLTANGYTPEQAMEMMISPMQNTINISNIYSVRDVENLPEADITRNTRGERNLLDLFFIRIEGEEFNGAYANN